MAHFLAPLVVDLRPGPEGKTANFYFGQNHEGQIIFCYTPKELFVGTNRESLSEFLPTLASRMIALVPRPRKHLVTYHGELGPAARRPIETLSKGFKRRVGLAAALLHDPPTLILDEPTDGLDPNQKHAVRTLIRRLAPEKAIIVSTHILEEVDAVCTRAMIIDQGVVKIDDTPAGLAARHPSGRLDEVFRAFTTYDAGAALSGEGRA